MAKITITIRDIELVNRVEIISDPSFESMMKSHLGGKQFTAAEAYAIAMINKVRELSRDNFQKTLKVIIPKVRRPR